MQDFEVTFTAGVTLERWDDPPRPANPDVGEPGHNPDLPVGPGAPSRLNPIPEFPHKMFVGKVGTEIEITATVAGVAGPMDTALGGRPFVPWFVEMPCVQGFVSPAGQSSVIRFTPELPGHYCIGVGRTNGGHVLMHCDVGT